VGYHLWVPNNGGRLVAGWRAVRTIWKYAFDRVKQETEVSQALILGLGGGSIAKLIRENWKDSKITGVDVDPVIVELGKDYLGLSHLNVDILIGDAYEFLEKAKKVTYDLVCVDTYVGDSFPKQFESPNFLENVKKCLSENGVAVFNRLYYSDKRKAADAFEVELSKHFKFVKSLYPELSALYVCSDKK
jgi:spermidine synthase